MRFANKICLVTGGGSGIGRAACLQLAAEGGTVVVLNRDETTVRDTVALSLLDFLIFDCQFLVK